MTFRPARLALLLLPSLAFALAPSSPQDEAVDAWAMRPPSHALVISSDAELAGVIVVDSLHLARGARVTVTGDLAIHCTGEVLLEGEIVARAPQPTDASPDGPDIEIVTAGWLYVGGRVKGAAGFSFESEEGANFGSRGGHGSSVRLVGGRVTLDAVVRAGDGGNGGAGADGGNGGDLRLGGELTREGARGPRVDGLYGSRGGNGGKGWKSAGGDGGGSGAVVYEE